MFKSSKVIFALNSIYLLVGFWWIFQAHFELRGWAGRLRSLVRILGVILANVVMVFPQASANLGLSSIFAVIIIRCDLLRLFKPITDFYYCFGDKLL